MYKYLKNIYIRVLVSTKITKKKKTSNKTLSIRENKD